MKISTASADRKAHEQIQARTPKSEGSWLQDLCALGSLFLVMAAAVTCLPDIAAMMH